MSFKNFVTAQKKNGPFLSPNSGVRQYTIISEDRPRVNLLMLIYVLVRQYLRKNVLPT